MTLITSRHADVVGRHIWLSCLVDRVPQLETKGRFPVYAHNYGVIPLGEWECVSVTIKQKPSRIHTHTHSTRTHTSYQTDTT